MNHITFFEIGQPRKEELKIHEALQNILTVMVSFENSFRSPWEKSFCNEIIVSF